MIMQAGDEKYTSAQLQATALLALAMTAYLAVKKPFLDKETQAVHTASQAVVYAVCALQLAFLDYNKSIDSKLAMAEVVTAMCIIATVANVGLFLRKVY